jgi:CheY-like chemotaxis protein
MGFSMPKRQRTVVIVDDESDTAEMLAEMMRLNGYRVLKTFGGTPAIGLISNQKPDVVILDLMMPDLPGVEVLRFIRRDPRLEKIPVVVVSAKNMPADIRGCLDAGATAYLTKPVTYQDLKTAVESAVKEAAGIVESSDGTIQP